jgi:hypothetical protein
MLTSWKAKGNADIVTLASKLNYVRQLNADIVVVKRNASIMGMQAEC